jgi:hypothetical protein
MPVEMDAPSKVSLFVYDNQTFVVESYRDQAVQVKVTVQGAFTKLRNLANGEVTEGKAIKPGKGQEQSSFEVTVAPHSFLSFREE